MEVTLGKLHEYVLERRHHRSNCNQLQFDISCLVTNIRKRFQHKPDERALVDEGRQPAPGAKAAAEAATVKQTRARSMVTMGNLSGKACFLTYKFLLGPREPPSLNLRRSNLLNFNCCCNFCSQKLHTNVSHAHRIQQVLTQKLTCTVARVQGLCGDSFPKCLQPFSGISLANIYC